MFLFILLRETQPRQQIVTIKNQKLLVEVARTLQEKSKGLCCRDSLPENHGMLFVYDQPGDYGFWMKNTRIALDIYWINTNKEIVYIENSVQPDSFPKTFRSLKPAHYVLETSAGYAKKHGIKVGDEAQFRTK